MRENLGMPSVFLTQYILGFLDPSVLNLLIKTLESLANLLEIFYHFHLYAQYS